MSGLMHGHESVNHFNTYNETWLKTVNYVFFKNMMIHSVRKIFEELIAQRSASMIESAVHMAEMKDTNERKAPQNESNKRMREDGGWSSSMT